MRIVHFAPKRRSGALGPSRVGFAQDYSPEPEIIDLELARTRLKLKVSDLPRGASVRQIISMPPGTLRRLGAAVKQLFRDIDRNLRLRQQFLVDTSAIAYLPPIPDPEKIICVGQNYVDHCREQKAPIPKSPIIFAKFPPSLTGHGGKVVLPSISRKVDFEAELAFVIGKEGRHIRRQDAYKHVAGYMALNDVSARDIQFADGQWIRGKACETFAPCGPALVTRDEIPDPQRLGISLTLNGETMQSSNTKNLIFNVPHLVSFLSRAFTLKPGDIVSTGTPPGVGCFRKPPIFLRSGDAMTVHIARIGHLTSHVVAEKRGGGGRSATKKKSRKHR